MVCERATLPNASSGSPADSPADSRPRKNTLVKYLPMRGHETEALRRLRRFSNINFDPPLRYVDGNRVQLAEGDPRNRLLDWVQNHVAQK